MSCSREKDFRPAHAPQRFRKLPIVVEAVQWMGHNLWEVMAFTKQHAVPDADCLLWSELEELVNEEGLKISTLEGRLNADVGDWIIKGIKGEFYPCKPDVFYATYERAQG